MVGGASVTMTPNGISPSIHPFDGNAALSDNAIAELR
jgi:hypothetical protein